MGQCSWRIVSALTRSSSHSRQSPSRLRQPEWETQLLLSFVSTLTGHGHSMKPEISQLAGAPFSNQGRRKKHNFRISVTFQVTWMLCEVIGCNVTSMGGPSGAGVQKEHMSQALAEDRILCPHSRPPELEDSRGWGEKLINSGEP